MILDCNYNLKVFINNPNASARNLRMMKPDLKEYEIPYVMGSIISYADIRELLMLSENGFPDICYTDRLPSGYEDMLTSDLITYLLDHPRCLHDVIVTDGQIITNGYYGYRDTYLKKFKERRV